MQKKQVSSSPYNTSSSKPDIPSDTVIPIPMVHEPHLFCYNNDNHLSRITNLPPITLLKPKTKV